MTQTHFHHRAWKEVVSHKVAYTILLLGLLSFVCLFVWAGQRLVVQRSVMIGLGVFYAAWGVVTHVSSRRVTNLLLLEYFVVSALATVILLLLTI